MGPARNLTSYNAFSRGETTSFVKVRIVSVEMPSDGKAKVVYEGMDGSPASSTWIMEMVNGWIRVKAARMEEYNPL